MRVAAGVFVIFVCIVLSISIVHSVELRSMHYTEVSRSLSNSLYHAIDILNEEYEKRLLADTILGISEARNQGYIGTEINEDVKLFLEDYVIDAFISDLRSQLRSDAVIDVYILDNFSVLEGVFDVEVDVTFDYAMRGNDGKRRTGSFPLRVSGVVDGRKDVFGTSFLKLVD